MLALLVACFVLLAGSPTFAQVKTAFPEHRGLKLGDFPRVIKLAKDVYAYEDIRDPGFTTVSFFVVGNEGVLLADGQWHPPQTRKLVETIASITSKPIKWYVVGSEHLDHTGGNSVLPKDIRYIVHPTSKRQLEQDAIATAKQPKSYPVVVPPVAMTSDKEVVDIGGRKVEVLFMGRAHTGGDLVVLLPDEKILFMSEVYFNRVFPAMRAGFSQEWLSTIDKALAMDIKTYVPGHGFVEEPGVSRVQLVEFRGALQYVTEEARRLSRLGLSPEDAMKQADWGPYKDWMLADSQRLVALRRVFAEMRGEGR
jgi:glyoxylase-like metal-dependent hydrolase (beta-lactamase superfamily II)